MTITDRIYGNHTPSGRLQSRRQFLRDAALLAGSACTVPRLDLFADDAQQAKGARPKVAAIVTEFTYRSHGHVILENFVEPYLFNGKLLTSPVDVASIYFDQLPKNETGTQAARDYKIPVYKTIPEALCLGTGDLAVDAVLLIGEHGKYPVNDLGQHEYPRKRFFDETVNVLERAKKPVPIFNDKHLSYRWDWAKEMYDTAKRLGIPFMAGSSVPLAQRRPAFELPAGAEIEEIVSVQGGPVESYDFHGLEVLQSLAEGRKGGETGISSVEFLTGDALFKAADAGRWSLDLAEAAVADEQAVRKVPLRELIRQPARAILLQYKDGLKGTVLSVGYSAVRWSAALKLKNDAATFATYFYGGPWNNRGFFRALAHAIQQHFVERKSPFPVERTLLTTGALDAAMHSRHANGQPQPTPHLEFAYEAADFRTVREMGRTWDTITPETPEPRGMKRDPAP
ncbi:MAG: hypothetical protein HY290_23150 [Planctomycetia bacterium]|nr:hypothetical protein [Planctomycetia bacterium]